ncbi:MAG: TenA family transcriptional regulator [Planctomycetes bacterium]|nr:TenA family transcriptional regulator [Planctomycetota bacterium]
MSRFDNSLLVLRAGTLWQEATAAAFLNAIGDGTLSPEAFNRWMVQDYHFVDALTSFQGIAAAKTPRQFRKPLIAGLGALDAEMDWFEAQASARGLTLNAPVHEVCRHHCDFLIQAAYREPYPVLLAVLFGVEASYLAAWSGLPPKGPYAEFIDQWSNPRFAEYVESLRVLTEGNQHDSSQGYFDSVLAHERDFWRMTLEG